MPLKILLGILFQSSGPIIARPFAVMLWLVCLYAFPTAMGWVGVWLWLVPSMIAIAWLQHVYQPMSMMPG